MGEIQIKNNQWVMICQPVIEDAVGMLKFLNQHNTESEFLSRYPEERKDTIESVQRRILNTFEDSNVEFLIVKKDERIIGQCQIVFLDTIKTKHRAKVMFGVLKDYWSLGIGSALMKELIQIARNHQIKQLELEVMEGNNRAIALYQKFGFEIVAKIPNAYILKDGSIHQEIIMTLQL